MTPEDLRGLPAAAKLVQIGPAMVAPISCEFVREGFHPAQALVEFKDGVRSYLDIRHLWTHAQYVARLAPKPEKRDVPVWLIEYKGFSSPAFYGRCGIGGSASAIRFARKQDAEDLIYNLKMRDAFASEHLFL